MQQPGQHFNTKPGHQYWDFGFFAMFSLRQRNDLQWRHKSIGAESFEACVDLTRLVIPSSVANIGVSAFEGTSLTNVSILGNANIGDYAFYQLPLCSVFIAGGSIGSFGFELCTNLTSLTLGAGLTNIGLDAFNSDPITGLVIPGSVNSIGEDAFAVSQLTNLIISEGVSTIGEGAFALNHITSLTIPASVTSIGDQAFYMSINLTNVIIGAGVRYHLHRGIH